MLDHAEMIIEIDRLIREINNDMNNRKLEEAKMKLEKLSMAASMFQKYLDWIMK